MLDIQKNNTIKYLLFTSLYFSEGIQLSITTVLVPIFLLEQDLSAGAVSLSVGVIMLPWVLKFIFGYLVDSYQTINKKYFTLYGGLISALGLIFVGFTVSQLNILFSIFLLFGAQCAITILDVSIDAWAITTTKKEERGSINGTMMAGFFSGLAFGSTTLTSIAEHYGYPPAFFTGAIIITLLMSIPFLTKKPTAQDREKPLLSSILNEFKRPFIRQITLLLPLISINSGLITLAVPIFMNQQLDLSVSHIGFITTIFTIGRIIGALGFGLLSDHITRMKTLWYIIIISIIASALLITVDIWESLTIIYTLIGVLNGGLFSVLFALLMDVTNKKISAVQFSIFIGFINGGELLGSTVSGTLIDLIGFSRVFLIAAWIFGPSLLLLFWLRTVNRDQH